MQPQGLPTNAFLALGFGEADEFPSMQQADLPKPLASNSLSVGEVLDVDADADAQNKSKKMRSAHQLCLLPARSRGHSKLAKLTKQSMRACSANLMRLSPLSSPRMAYGSSGLVMPTNSSFPGSARSGCLGSTPLAQNGEAQKDDLLGQQAQQVVFLFFLKLAL